MQEMIKVEELSKRLAVPEWTIRKWIRDQKIPAYKPGKSYLLDPEEVISTIKKEFKTH